MPSESSFLVSPVEPVTRSPPQSPTSAVTEADLVAATEKGVTLKKCVEVDCRRRHAARQTPSESEACDTESASTATASSSDGYSSESKGGMEMPTSRAEGAKTTNGAASDLTNATAAPTSSDSATTFSVLPSWETLDRDLFAVFLFPFVALGFVLMALQEELFRAVRGSLGWTAAAAAPRGELPPCDPETGRREVPIFFADELTPEKWSAVRRRYVDHCVPIVIRASRSGGDISPLRAPKRGCAGGELKDTVAVTLVPYRDALPGIDSIVSKLFGSALPFSLPVPRAYWPLWFSGSYTQGASHIDLGNATTNVYFLARGEKDVVICPPHVTEKLKLETGYDSLFIPESAKDLSRSWLSKCEEHYHVSLKPQSVLVFSNAGCLHHFRNGEGAGSVMPEALSTRLKYDAGMDRRAFWHELTDPSLWWRSSLTVAAFLFLGAARENRPAKVVQEGKTE